MGLRPWIIGTLAGGLLIALGIAAYQMGIDEGEKRARAQPGTTATSAAPTPKPKVGPGKALFAAKCGSCHTLAGAATSGKMGPNLDDLRPDRAQALAAIKNGGTGSGQMPRNAVQGAEAEQVAAFVAATAGR